MHSVRVTRLLGGLALLGLALLVPALVPTTDGRMLMGAALDAGHLVLYGTSAWILLQLLQNTVPVQGRRRILLYLAALAGVAVLGMGTEFAQKFAHRDAEVVDVERDLLGGGAVLLLAWAFDRGFRVGRVARALLIFGSLVCLTAGLAEIVSLSRAYLGRNGAFPSICGFDDPWELRFVRTVDASLTRVDPPGEWKASGQVGRLDLRVAEYPGFAVKEPRADWSGYAALRFEVWSQEPGPVPLVLRVHDAAHDQTYEDRFNRELVVQPGANVFRIALAEIEQGPAQRRLDLHHVGGFALFAAHPGRPLTFWLDSFELVRE